MIGKLKIFIIVFLVACGGQLVWVAFNYLVTGTAPALHGSVVAYLLRGLFAAVFAGGVFALTTKTVEKGTAERSAPYVNPERLNKVLASGDYGQYWQEQAKLEQQKQRSSTESPSDVSTMPNRRDPRVVAAERQFVAFDFEVARSEKLQGCSHFGGLPRVPPGFAWPKHVGRDKQERPMTFLLQVDCADIPVRARLAAMPDFGILQFYMVTHERDLGDGFAVRYFGQPVEQLAVASAAQSNSVQLMPKHAFGLRRVEIPDSAFRDIDPERSYWGFPIDRDLAGTDLQGKLGRSEYVRMLGAGSDCQDILEAVAADHIMLVQFQSDDLLGYHFGEGVFQFWIKPEDLLAKRFDKVVFQVSSY